jgi:hypothetical protein
MCALNAITVRILYTLCKIQIKLKQRKEKNRRKVSLQLSSSFPSLYIRGFSGHDDDGYGDGSEYYKPELSPEEQFRLDAIKRLVEQGPKPKSLSSSQLSSTMPTNEYDALIQSFEPRILSKNEEGEVVANQNRGERCFP